VADQNWRGDLRGEEFLICKEFCGSRRELRYLKPPGDYNFYMVGKVRVTCLVSKLLGQDDGLVGKRRRAGKILDLHRLLGLHDKTPDGQKGFLLI
jgi:hypothetical protein